MDLTLASLTADLRALVPQVETDVEQDDAAERAVKQALNIYSRYNPRIQVAAFTGDGSTRLFAMPSDYIPPFSKVLSVEYPYGLYPPEILDANDYQIYIDIDEEGVESYKILFLSIPAANYVARVKYTALHVLSGYESSTTTSIPSPHWSAFLYLSAYCLANFAVGYYGSTTRSTLSADTINYRTKADEWRAIAEHYYASFKAAMGMRADDAVPSAVVVAKLTRDGDSIWRSD